MADGEFVPGLDLSRAFYGEAVQPIIGQHFPGLAYSAALIGRGSDVLGYDSARSMDHDWGPRVMLFLRDDDHAACTRAIHDILAQQLPATFRGFSTNFGPPQPGGVRVMEPVAGPPIAHRVYVLALSQFLQRSLGFDPSAGISVDDWLTTPSQRLLEWTAGAVFHDGLAALNVIRAALSWYPHDVWLYIIACQWQRIAEEEPFVARADEAGDEIGARIVATRIARDLMRLCFLFERRYAPYSKWLGTAFGELRCGDEIEPLLQTALAAAKTEDRQRALTDACVAAARIHNALGITEFVDASARAFHDRPYVVLGADRFARASKAAIETACLRTLDMRGAIDQWVDSTVVTNTPGAWRATSPARCASTGDAASAAAAASGGQPLTSDRSA
ncbi:MAG TPA: DUF4037 domain-containing protein [Dehalococcoidia bacterium]